MKLIIDIPEDELTEDEIEEAKRIADDCFSGVKTIIPDKATNGDVMKAVFNCKTSDEDSDYLVKYSLDGIYAEVNSDWWHTEYQKDF